MTAYPIRIAASVSMLALAIGSPGIAQAQSTPSASAVETGLEDIIVTARRIAESAQKTPVAITAFSGADIKNQSVQSFPNLAQQTPGLTISNGGTGGASFPFLTMRGMAQETIQLSVDTPVGLYTDGIYTVNSAGVVINHFLDIERVEVLKGPQGTLYGRNTTGGAISIHTKVPVLDAVEGEVNFGLGNYNRVELSGVVNVPIVPGKVALRVVAGNYDRDGFSRDLIQQRDVSAEHTKTVRVSLLAEPTDKLSILLRGNWQHSSDGGFGARAFYMQPGGPGNIVAAIQLYGAPVDATKLANALAFFYDRADGGDDHDIYSNYINSNKLDVASGSATITYDLGNAVFKSITGYTWLKNTRTLDSAPVGLNLLYSEGGFDFEQIQQEFQVNGTALDDNLKYTLGFFYYNMNGIDGVGLSSVFGGPFGVTSARLKTDAKALYGQLTYALLSNLNVTAGLRGTKETKKVIPYLFQPGLVLPFSNKNLSYTFGLDWTVERDVMLYARTSRGNKSGGFNQRVVANPASIAKYKPEVATDYELGIKSQWFDNHLRLNADVYYIDYKDIQRSGAAAFGNVSTIITKNAAAATIKGAETEITAIPFDALQLKMTASYIDPKYDKYLDGNLAIPAQTFDQSFQRFKNISKWAYSVSAAYTLPTGAGDLRTQVDWNWRSSYDLYPSDAPGTVRIVNGVAVLNPGVPDSFRIQRSYGLLNASIALHLDKYDADVRLYAKNIMGKEVLTQAVTYVGTGFGFAAGTPGDPMIFGVEFSKKF